MEQDIVLTMRNIDKNFPGVKLCRMWILLLEGVRFMHLWEKTEQVNLL